MKKALLFILCLFTVALVAFTYGFQVFRNLPGDPVATRTPERISSSVQSTQTTASEPGLIDINTATLEELMTLPGIGQTYAQRILDYRQENGPFQSVSELLNIDGIGTARLEKILDLITLGGQS